MIDLLRKRRSIRHYKVRPIDSKTLNLLIEAALRAPSSRNIRPCEIIIVDDPALLEKLSQSKGNGSQFLKGAALGIVVCADSTKSDVWVEDCSIVSTLLHVEAHSLGLGSCWIQIRNRKRADGTSSEEYIQTMIGLLPHIKVLAIISIGHPAEKKNPLLKSQLQFDKIRYNHYSNGYKYVPGKVPAKKGAS